MKMYKNNFSAKKEKKCIFHFYLYFFRDTFYKTRNILENF